MPLPRPRALLHGFLFSSRRNNDCGRLETTTGDVVIEVVRSWSPRGADRFYNLVTSGYFTDVRFFRIVPGFIAQFGIHGDPKVSRVWSSANILDDEVKQRNQRGTIVFAKTGR